MTEQEKQEKIAEGKPDAAAEASKAAAAAEPKKAARAERKIEPAGPETAVVAPKRRPGEPGVSRRGVLRLGFWAGMGAAISGTLGATLALVWPRKVEGFGGTVSAGEVSQFPPGSKTANAEGRFWLVNLTEEQGGPGFLALWRKCPHLGCTVPWKDKFVWPDPMTGAPKEGWFRCPCHGSTYTDAGVLVFGPAPRPMDTMALTIKNGRITVNTGDITPGRPDNPDRAVRS